MAYFGQPLPYPDSTSSIELSTSTDKMSFRFTSQNTGSVSIVYVNVSSKVGTSPTYRVGLQSTGHINNPSGTWLGSTNTAYKDTQLIAGWNAITLNESASLVSGTIYHLGIQYSSGAIDSSNFVFVRCGPSGKIKFHPQLPTADEYLETMAFGAGGETGWNGQNKTPVFYLGTSNEGWYSTLVGNQSIYGNYYRGESFIPTSDTVVSTFEAFVKKSGTPADSLYYDIRRESDNVILRSGTLAAEGSVSTSYSWVGTSLSSTLTLTSGVRYIFALSSPLSTISAFYRISQATFSLSSTSFDTTNSRQETSSSAGANWNYSPEVDSPIRSSIDSSSTTTSTSTSTSSTSSTSSSTSSTSSSISTSSTSSTSSSTSSTSSSTSSTSSTSTSSTSSTSSSTSSTSHSTSSTSSSTSSTSSSTSSTSSTSLTGTTSTSSTSSTSISTSITLAFKPHFKEVKTHKASIRYAGGRKLWAKTIK